MRVTLLDEPFPYHGSGLFRSAETENPHASTLIKELLRSIDAWPFKDTIDEAAQINFELGFLWEDLLGMAWGARAGVRPPEVLHDGIAASPDGLEGPNVGNLAALEEAGVVQLGRDELIEIAGPFEVLHEYKITALGIPTMKGDEECANKIASNQYWMLQVKAYCACVGVTRVKHHVLHYNGNYSDRRQRIYQVYQTDFTQREVDETWRALRRIASKLEA